MALDVADAIGRAAEPLADIDDPAFAAAFDRFADARVVLLGESSHGTSEFYRARAAISRRFIERHGFRIVAVEADWPDAAAVDRQVRGLAPLPGAEAPFQRFPRWMWRNEEVRAFTRWLQGHNAGRAAGDQAGFYGLDMYSLGASIQAVLAYLDGVDPEAAKAARERYGCLEPWQRDPAVYGRMAIGAGQRTCEQAVVGQLRALLERRLDYAASDAGGFLDAAQNARLVAAAERYYRVMYYRSEESWNLRDTHMAETLGHVLDAHGAEAKALVWAHNSHIGNAAATEMGRTGGETNLGQLCRERFGERAVLIGQGSHAGTVAAAADWDGPMAVKQVRPSLPGSWERLCHDSGVPRFLLDLRAGRLDASLRQALAKPVLERFIGVVYRPDTERWSHYAESSPAHQFDAWVWFDRTTAVTPLAGVDVAAEGAPSADETYPFGV